MGHHEHWHVRVHLFIGGSLPNTVSAVTTPLLKTRSWRRHSPPSCRVSSNVEKRSSPAFANTPILASPPSPSHTGKDFGRFVRRCAVRLPIEEVPDHFG